MKAVKSTKGKIHIVKVNIMSQESFDKWHEKTCGRIKDRYYKSIKGVWLISVKRKE